MGSVSAACANLWGDSMRLWLKPSRLLRYVLIAATLSFVHRVIAQTTTSGGLTGVITDQTNAAVPSADVEIKDVERGTTQSTHTDREGLYEFFFVVPNRYTLIVTHNGFREERRT